MKTVIEVVTKGDFLTVIEAWQIVCRNVFLGWTAGPIADKSGMATGVRFEIIGWDGKLWRSWDDIEKARAILLSLGEQVSDALHALSVSATVFAFEAP